MKKTVLALAIALSFSTVAQAYEYSPNADNYTVAHSRDKFCSDEADWGANVYTQVKMVGKVSKESEMSVVTNDKYATDLEQEINARAVNYAFDEADSAQDAYQGTYAECMDLLTAGDQYVH
ncbi:MAG: hypothetical protein AWT59_2374 [Candidatus Gallionella acididurans]|uniref:Uncharacterized protein n=1 Tax=Candidatus Gallionella acididurans TaxID=1796491 RepID=A0A139BR71_9PROT|nr:MAG: hypothetical protein AWT59_2374 [Candidatus Gallionella acididurans]